jgi:hypothetical protein
MKTGATENSLQSRWSAWWLVDAARSGRPEYPKDLYYHDKKDQETYFILAEAFASAFANGESVTTGFGITGYK